MLLNSNKTTMKYTDSYSHAPTFAFTTVTTRLQNKTENIFYMCAVQMSALG